MPAIFQWKSSYYVNDTKQWCHGELFLYQNCVKYIEEEDCKQHGVNPVKLVVKLSSINTIKKATSTLIFSCIVFNVRSENLWFSSLKDRNHVFNLIEHFWKDQLTGSILVPLTKLPSDDLMRIVYDTQDSLMEAANTLHHQGRQLKNASQTMHYMNENLTITEMVTEELEAWFGGWSVTPATKKHSNHHRDPSRVNNDRIEYQVLVGKVSQESHTNGYVVFKENVIDILNEKSAILFTFQVNQISEINMHSPWDLTIVSRKIGTGDVTAHVICTRMSSLINSLQNVYKRKLDYDGIPATNPLVEKLNDQVDFGFKSAATTSTDASSSDSQSNHGGSTLVKKQKTLSDEDTTQISAVLHNIKSLAVDIGVEQDAQMQLIDSLDQSVDGAQTRIHSTNVRVKKLT